MNFRAFVIEKEKTSTQKWNSFSRVELFGPKRIVGGLECPWMLKWLCKKTIFAKVDSCKIGAV